MSLFSPRDVPIPVLCRTVIQAGVAMVALTMGALTGTTPRVDAARLIGLPRIGLPW